MANKNPINNNKASRGKNKRSGNSPKRTSAETRELLARQLNIKPKTAEFVDNLLSNPTKGIGEVYQMNHDIKDRANASRAASRLLKKPQVIGYKDAAVGKAKRRIVTLIDSSNESIALKASQEVIDRNEGKATIKSETLNRTVEVKLDLTGLRIGSHHIQAGTNVPIEP